MDFVDRDLTCVQCSKTFVFFADEQKFFRDKGFNHDPKRCKQCKLSGTRGVTIETEVTCYECGIDTTVPFKPTGQRPVFCSACFKSQPKQPNTGIALVKSASNPRRDFTTASDPNHIH
jgi:CxxC-x17-CxxC domain-containing protein